MKFKDLMNSKDDDLTEQAIAMMGDWDAKDDMGSISLFMLNKEWTYIEDLFNMKLYKHNSVNAWILGEVKSIEGEEKPRLKVAFRIDFTNRKNIGHKFGYIN